MRVKIRPVNQNRALSACGRRPLSLSPLAGLLMNFSRLIELRDAIGSAAVSRRRVFRTLNSVGRLSLGQQTLSCLAGRVLYSSRGLGKTARLMSRLSSACGPCHCVCSPWVNVQEKKDIKNVAALLWSPFRHFGGGGSVLRMERSDLQSRESIKNKQMPNPGLRPLIRTGLGIPFNGAPFASSTEELSDRWSVPHRIAWWHGGSGEANEIRLFSGAEILQVPPNWWLVKTRGGRGIQNERSLCDYLNKVLGIRVHLDMDRVCVWPPGHSNPRRTLSWWASSC